MVVYRYGIQYSCTVYRSLAWYRTESERTIPVVRYLTVQRHRGGGRERATGRHNTERGLGPSKTARRHRPQEQNVRTVYPYRTMQYPGTGTCSELTRL